MVKLKQIMKNNMVYELCYYKQSGVDILRALVTVIDPEEELN